jgi:hypothetical protein
MHNCKIELNDIGVVELSYIVKCENRNIPNVIEVSVERNTKDLDCFQETADMIIGLIQKDEVLLKRVKDVRYVERVIRGQPESIPNDINLAMRMIGTLDSTDRIKTFSTKLGLELITVQPTSIRGVQGLRLIFRNVKV